jgi:hypothetical protein
MVSEISQYQYLDRMAKQAMYQKRRDAQFRILARRRFIANSMSKFNAAKFLMENLEGRKLLFAGSIAQAEDLCKNVYHSKSDNKALKAFQKGEINEIAMVDAGGTGFTYRAIDHLIVVQTDSDKNGRTSQKISRTLLQQKDYKAIIWLVSLTGTQDEKWVESALENFDRSKVRYERLKNFLTGEEYFKKHFINKL